MRKAVENGESQSNSADKPKHVLEPGGTEFTTAAGGARRYRKPLKAFRWCDIHMLVSDSFDGWSKHKAPRLGASLACYTLLSLAPLPLVVVAIVGLVFGHTAAERGIVEQVRTLLGNEGAKAAAALLEGSRNTAHGIVATAIGLITLLFGASGVMIELRDALNTIWEVPTREVAGLKNKALAFIKEAPSILRHCALRRIPSRRLTCDQHLDCGCGSDVRFFSRVMRPFCTC